MSDAKPKARPRKPRVRPDPAPLRRPLGRRLVRWVTRGFLVIAGIYAFLIVLFGLWEAWKLSRGVGTEMAGPFRVGPATSEIATT